MPLDGFGKVADSIEGEWYGPETPVLELQRRMPELDRIIEYAKARSDETTMLVLQEAMRLIEKGWCQKAYAKCGFLPVDAKWWIATRYCSRGAISRAVRNLGLPHLETASAAIALSNVLDGADIIKWNDARDQTKANVIVGFRLAIEQQRVRVLEAA